MTAYLLDTETTCLDEAEVIELAHITINPPQRHETWSLGASFLQRYLPLKPIQWGAMAVHHILPEELEGCPASSTAAIPPDTSYLIGHNIDFDWKALGQPAVRRICTLALARALWPECDSHTISALIYFLNGPTQHSRKLLRNAHSAQQDIENNWLILQSILLRLNVQTLGELWAASEKARVPLTMTFGKHKGKKIAEVDKGYANWYARQEDTDPYLLLAFRQAGLLPSERK